MNYLAHKKLRIIGGTTLALTLALFTGACTPTGAPAQKSMATIALGNWESGDNANDSDFDCTANFVMTGREHKGDENSELRYRCGRANQFGQLNTKNSAESTGQKESSHEFTCTANKVMIGQSHTGDENGETTYTCANVIDSWGNTMYATPIAWHDSNKESNHAFECPTNQVIIGRKHSGDENADTSYQCAQLW